MVSVAEVIVVDHVLSRALYYELEWRWTAIYPGLQATERQGIVAWLNVRASVP